MTISQIDHITVTSPNLQAGADFIKEVLGVEPQMGGEHPIMATHNLLLRLGETMYLEVIAPNPNSSPPGRPRWFGLDNLASDAAPRLSTWVVSVADIHSTVEQCSESLGRIEPMSRGKLNWLITIPPDGSVPLDGIAPALIQWQTERHPALNMLQQNVSLLGLEIYTRQPERLNRLFTSIGLEGPLEMLAISSEQTPSLLARIKTSQGIKELSTPL